MAEGFLRALAGDRFNVASAGTEATHVPQVLGSKPTAGGGGGQPPR